jgi:hypothetical protein
MNNRLGAFCAAVGAGGGRHPGLAASRRFLLSQRAQRSSIRRPFSRRAHRHAGLRDPACRAHFVGPNRITRAPWSAREDLVLPGSNPAGPWRLGDRPTASCRKRNPSRPSWCAAPHAPASIQTIVVRKAAETFILVTMPRLRRAVTRAARSRTRARGSLPRCRTASKSTLAQESGQSRQLGDRLRRLAARASRPGRLGRALLLAGVPAFGSLGTALASEPPHSIRGVAAAHRA